MNDCIKKIHSYMKADDISYPLFVNVETSEQKIELLDHFSVGDNAIVHVADFAKKDSLPNVMGIMNAIKRTCKNMLVFELTTYLKLIGGNELQRTMQTLSTMSVSKKVVIICFRCEEILKSLVQKDLRLAQQIVTIGGVKEKVRPHITFIAHEFSFELEKVIDGVEKLPEAIENTDVQDIYIRTNNKPGVFNKGQYAIAVLDTPLQILQNKYPELNRFHYTKEENAYWQYLLTLSEGKNSLRDIATEHFGSVNNYEYSLQEWYTYDDKIQWLMYVFMKVFPDLKNQIIKESIDSAQSHTEVIRGIVRGILKYSHDSKNFYQLYKVWKSLRFRLNVPDEEIADYCEFVDQKGVHAIYYLSDLTKREKEKAIKLIGQYQAEFDDKTLLNILKNNYVDLYDYVNPFFYNDEVLNRYFSLYTMQKVRNVLYPEFEEIVKEQAKEQHFVELPTRAEIVGEIDKDDSILYFVDALGVEYLNYILQKCTSKRMFAEPRYGKCNLPSITSTNKEFIDSFKACNAEIVDFIKEIDKDKHEALGDYNFEKSIYPIHLIDELAVIDKVITNIYSKLASNKYKRAYIISDHGASRLAVLKKSVLPIESKRTGTHGGRVCENNELTKDISCAIHEGELCILAGYDRFDGSRPASVETHGGATLEEVVVPIIKITMNDIVWEFKVMNEGNKVLFSYKKQPVLTIWSKNELSNLSARINGKMYLGNSDTDKKTFRFEIDKPEKECECKIELFVSGNCVKDGLLIKFEREGVQKSQRFTFGNMMFGGSKES